MKTYDFMDVYSHIIKINTQKNIIILINKLRTLHNLLSLHVKITIDNDNE